MKIRFNANDNLPFKKPLKLHLLTIIFRYISEEDGNFYPQLYLDDCLYELSMLQYDRIDIPEGIDVNETSASKECDIVSIVLLKILVLSTNHIFAMAVMI